MSLKLIVIWKFVHLLTRASLKALNMNHGMRFAGITVYAAQRLAGRRSQRSNKALTINSRMPLWNSHNNHK